MGIEAFQRPPSDSLTKWNGGNYFSFWRIRRGEITCRGDTLSQKFSNSRPLVAHHNEGSSDYT